MPFKEMSQHRKYVPHSFVLRRKSELPLLPSSTDGMLCGGAGTSSGVAEPF